MFYIPRLKAKITTKKITTSYKAKKRAVTPRIPIYTFISLPLEEMESVYLNFDQHHVMN